MRHLRRQCRYDLTYKVSMPSEHRRQDTVLLVDRQRTVCSLESLFAQNRSWDMDQETCLRTDPLASCITGSSLTSAVALASYLGVVKDSSGFIDYSTRIDGNAILHSHKEKISK